MNYPQIIQGKGREAASLIHDHMEAATPEAIVNSLVRTDPFFIEGALGYIGANFQGFFLNHVNWMSFKLNVTEWANAVHTGRTDEKYSSWVKHSSTKALLKTAIERIQDLLHGDDGQAWSEAEKFINFLKRSEVIPQE